MAAIAENHMRFEDVNPERDIVFRRGAIFRREAAREDYSALVSLCKATELVLPAHGRRVLASRIYDVLIEAGYRFLELIEHSWHGRTVLQLSRNQSIQKVRKSLRDSGRGLRLGDRRNAFPQRSIKFFLRPDCPVSMFALNTTDDIRWFAAALFKWKTFIQQANRTIIVRTHPALDQLTDLMRHDWGNLLVSAIQSTMRRSLNMEHEWLFETSFLSARQKAAIRRCLQRNKALKMCLANSSEDNSQNHLLPSFLREALETPDSVTLVCQSLMKMGP